MDCVADVRAILGEGPCWSVREQSLFWTDINAPRLFCWNAKTGMREYHVRENICSIMPRASGGYVGAGYNGLVTLDADFNITPLGNPEPDLPGNRFNDGKLDRHGRFWAGTMDHSEKTDTGTLYRIDIDHSWTAIDTGYRVTNGPAFSADGRTLYHTDSAVQRIYVFALDSNGKATDRRLFLQFGHQDGYPDGMTVDAEDCLWVAFWDGWCIRRFSPEGKLLAQIPVPVQRPTSVAFGGANMDEIFITSALRDLTTTDLASQLHAGGLFSFKPGVRGIADIPFAG